MFKKPNCPVIAVEEHYWDAELSKTYTGLESGRPGPQMDRLFDLGALRLKEMDEVGIDVQVISHGAPSAQELPAAGAALPGRGGGRAGGPRPGLPAPRTGSRRPAPLIRSASLPSRPCRRTIRRPRP